MPLTKAELEDTEPKVRYVEGHGVVTPSTKENPYWIEMYVPMGWRIKGSNGFLSPLFAYQADADAVHAILGKNHPWVTKRMLKEICDEANKDNPRYNP